MMVPDQSKDAIKTTTTTPAAPKGLAAMFGGAMPLKYQTPAKTTPLTATASTSMKAAKDLEQTSAGGSWKSVTKRKNSGMSLAARARRGINVTIDNRPAKAAMMDGEDIDMGGMGKKGKPKRFSPYGGAKKRPVNVAPEEKPVDVLIQGFEPGTEAGVISSLQIKSKKDWQPLDCKVNGSEMLLTVNGNVIAGILTRLDGYLVGTQQLHIRFFNSNDNAFAAATPSVTNKKETTIDILRAFLKSRWIGNMGYLNLESMHTDPFLKKKGIRAPGTTGASATVGPAMMKLAGEMFQNDIITLSLAKNRLINVQCVSTVAQYLPQLQNLSLQDNLIKNYEGLDALSGTGKLPHLRELIMSGNPLVESECKKYGHARGYLRNIVKRFPTLALLDGQPVALSEEEAQAIQKTGKVLPLDTKHNYYDNEESQMAALTFLTNYFNVFDSPQRSNLAAIYDAQATFSVSALLRLRSQTKLKRKEKKKLMVDDETLEWTTINRNLKLKKQTSKGLVIGSDAIGETLQRLPTTIHDYSNAKEFVMDAHQTPLGLVLTIHGEFKQDENAAPFSFDRTFLLRPSLPGSPAALAESPFTILTDSLTVRDYNGTQGFQPQINQGIQSIFASMPGLPTLTL